MVPLIGKPRVSKLMCACEARFSVESERGVWGIDGQGEERQPLLCLKWNEVRKRGGDLVSAEDKDQKSPCLGRTTGVLPILLTRTRVCF